MTPRNIRYKKRRIAKKSRVRKYFDKNWLGNLERKKRNYLKNQNRKLIQLGYL